MNSTPPSPEVAAPVPLPVKKILVPLDFSDCSLFALRYAVNLAKQVDANLLLVHVASSLLTPPEMEYVHVDLKKFRAEVEKHASAKLAAVAEQEIPTTVFASPIVRHGAAWEEITGVAKEHKADLIVIGTRGYSRLKHMLLGSTAEKVVRCAGCPVLVVRDYGK
ncbi:MAG TPA: universal stress protein [Verrucomicrobiae bacterium]|nr:universal stress protein [Verrucomicrobiae bacterium]